MKKTFRSFLLFALMVLLSLSAASTVQAANSGFVTKSNGDTYYYTKSGKMVTGVKKIGKHYYVFSDNGKMYKNCYYANFKGQKFYLTDTGKALKGKKTYKTPGGKTRASYFNGDGTIAISSFKTIGKYTYYFSTDGSLRKNKLWKNPKNKKYYYSDKYGRICKNGWTTVGGSKYYFSKNTGAAVTGAKKIGSYYYGFASNGKMYTNRYYATNGKKYMLGKNGRALTGLYSTDSAGTKTYYFNGDGTVKTNRLIDVNGKRYYVSSSGLVSKKGYRKVNGRFYYFDEKTGAAITGVRIGTINGEKNRCYYFDPRTPKGYRIGKQTDGKGHWYFFSSTNGAAFSKFYCDTKNKKVYYIDPKTYRIKMSGTVTLSTLRFNVTSDGSLDIARGTRVTKNDSKRTKLLKYSLSQLFKADGGTGLPNTTPFNKIKSYSCTEYVSRVYREINIDLGTGDIINRCFDLNSRVYKSLNSSAKPGDIILWNMTDCTRRKDSNGDYWIIDHDNDGICDRIHAKNEFHNGVRYHIHHVSIYLGNGQLIDSSSGDGVTIHDIAPDTPTYYISSVVNVIDQKK